MTGRPSSPLLTRRMLCGAAILLPALILPRTASAAIDFGAGAIDWQKPAVGLAAAKGQRKPVYLLVYADWCPACRAFSRLFFLPEVADALAGYVPVLANTDTDRFERQYRPDGGYIPRSLVLDPDGKHVEAVTGPYEHRYFLPPDDPGYLIDFLARGLAFATPEQMPLAEPARKAAPGQGPSFARADPAGRPGPAGNGPRRMKVPGATSAPPAPSATATVAPIEPATVAPAPAAPPPLAPESESIFRRLIGLFQS